MPEGAWVNVDVGDRVIEVLDCRQSILELQTGSESRAVAESFANRRVSDGLEFVDTYPEGAVAVESALKLPSPGGRELQDGALFKAVQMEDMFDIYNFGKSLYICHSWTGVLITRTDYFHQEGWLNCHIIRARSDLGESRHIERWLDFILKSHCLDMVCPHPIPPSVKRTERDILAYSFERFGRRAWYASYDETIGIYNSMRYGFPSYDTSLLRMSQEELEALARQVRRGGK